jgi:hypothetical protein
LSTTTTTLAIDRTDEQQHAYTHAHTAAAGAMALIPARTILGSTFPWTVECPSARIEGSNQPFLRLLSLGTGKDAAVDVEDVEEAGFARAVG